MTASALFAFLHFVAVFGIVATVFFQWLTFGRALTLADAQRIQLADRWYGICAAAVLVVGLLRVYRFEKGSEFYLATPFYHLKLGLFVLVGLLSVYPTIKYLGWRKDTRAGRAPALTARQYRTIAVILRLEVLGLMAVALCATLMARGIGAQ